MADDQKFETETMAGIYASQGHYRKAIEIYRRLLEQHPDRRDLNDKLLRIEYKQKYEDENRLTAKFSEWLELLMNRKKTGYPKEVSPNAADGLLSGERHRWLRIRQHAPKNAAGFALDARWMDSETGTPPAVALAIPHIDWKRANPLKNGGAKPRV